MTTEKWGGQRASRARAWVIARDHGICAFCDHPGANSLEHIIPKSIAPELMWDPSNWTATHLGTAGNPKGCDVEGCGCVGNIARRTTPIEVVRAVVQQMVCSCACTCGARTGTPPPPARVEGPHPLALGTKPPRRDTPNQQRMIREEQLYPDEQAAEAAAAYRKGNRTEWARIGYNVHLRRQQRARRGAPTQTESREW